MSEFRRRPGRQLQVRRKRRSGTGKFKLRKPVWVDPYPWIAGTNPEKRVFEALMQRHTYFIFQGQIPELEQGGSAYGERGYVNDPSALTPTKIKATLHGKQLTKYERWLNVQPRKRPVNVTLGAIEFIPDFVIPEYKVILDPFSPFHHSEFASVIRDQRKIGLYNSLGYEYYHAWVVAPGVFVVDEDVHTLGLWRRGKYLGQTKGVNVPHGRFMGADAWLDQLAALKGPPKYPLIDQRDITAKRTVGYRIGAGLGAGANSVAAANHKRRKPPKLDFKLRR